MVNKLMNKKKQLLFMKICY